MFVSKPIGSDNASLWVLLFYSATRQFVIDCLKSVIHPIYFPPHGGRYYFHTV